MGYNKRVLVIDNVMVTREGLVSVLNRVADLEVYDAPEYSLEVLEQVKKGSYEVVFLNVALGKQNSIVIGYELLKAWPSLKIIVYSNEPGVVLAAEVFRHEYRNLQPRRNRKTSVANPSSANPVGTIVALHPVPEIYLHGYILLKNVSPQNIDAMLKVIFQCDLPSELRHNNSIPARTVRYLDELYQRGKFIDPEVLDVLVERLERQHLTPREMDCCELISLGKSNKEISQQLGISQQAVENLINSVYNKLSISGEPKDPGRRVVLAMTMQFWGGLDTYGRTKLG